MATLPVGFVYVPGSTTLQLCTPCVGVGIGDPTITMASGRVTLTWPRADRLSGGTTDLLLGFSVTAGVTTGTVTSDVSASDDLGQTATAIGVAPVTVAAGTPVASGQVIVLSGQPTAVSATVGALTVGVAVAAPPPGATPIAQLAVGTPAAAPAIVPIAPYDQFVQAVSVSAYDAAGDPIHQLPAPLTLSITFPATAGLNARLARIDTVDSSGNTQMLPTMVIANPDGTFTATATTTHLSPFAVYGPGPGTPVPQVFVPLAIRG